MPSDVTDQYVCYSVDVTVPDVVPNLKRHIISIAPHIDNKKILHHALLFQYEPDASDTTPAIGATPVDCSPTVGNAWHVVYGWAPGGSPLTLPAEAGLPEQGTTRYVVQLHYNNLSGLQGETDGTGFDLCTTDDLRPNDADTIAFGTVNIDVKAHSSLDETCSFTYPTSAQAIHAFAALPHMHQIGTSISTQVTHAGQSTDLGTIAHWDFSTQQYLPLGDITIQPGDTLSTRCAWNNPTDTDVRFGPRTEDEMCYSFTLYYPKADIPWMTPSLVSQCVVNQ
jgi:hypothetical protein